MAGMIGGGTIRQEGERLSGVALQSSAYGLPIPIVHGTTRLPGNLIWYSNFVANAQTTTQGGKGGPSFENTSYTYTAALAFGLCEGPVAAIGRVWVGKEQRTLADLGFSAFLGGASQSTWGWMDTTHAAESLNYRRLAYVGASTYNLGNSASIGNHTFEISGPLRFGGPGSIIDANPKDSVVALLTDEHTGAGWSSARIGDLTQYSAACVANGIFVSLALTEQRAAADVVQEIVRATNAQLFSSEGMLKIAPYADRAATGNGVTYTPNVTPLYDLDDDDFIVDGPEDPVQCTRSSPADAFNQVTIEYLNRENDYNQDTAEAKDQANIEIFGLRPMPMLRLHCIHDRAIARIVVDQTLRRVLYLRNKYRFRLSWRYALLDPMDIVTITDGDLYRQPVRIVEIEESEDGLLDVVAEEMLGEVATAATYDNQAGSGYTPNYNVAPGDANPPVIFEPPIALAQEPAVWVAVSGGPYWGGCDVWISYDNATYRQLQRVTGASRTGVLSAALASGADPDSTHTLAVDLTESRGQLLSGVTADADALRTLCYVDGELIAYRDATLTSAHHYDLQYLRRGAYNTAIGAHASGAVFARLDAAVVRLPYTPDQVGDAIYLKFTSFNHLGVAMQSLADVTAVTYTITGSAISTVQNLALAQPFANTYCSIKWDPVIGAAGYQVVVKNGATTLRTVKTADTVYTYSYEDGTADGGPFRALSFEVTAIGSTAVSGTATVSATNTVPATPASIALSPGVMNVTVSAPRPADTDFAGMLVWASTTTGFTPGAGNLAYDGPDTHAVIGGTGGVPIYIRVAHYDTFGKTGLNVSGEVSATPTSLAADSIPVVSTLPAAGVVGRVLYLSTDDKLYRDDGTNWVTWVDGSDLLAASVTAGKMSVTSLSAISANIGSITSGSLTLDTAGFVATAGATWSAGTGVWMGYDSGAYKFRLGASGGLGISWNGTQLAINGGITLSASTDSYVRAGATDYSTGTGYFLGRSGGQYVLRIGNTTTNYMQWDGSALTVKGSIFTGDVQVDTGGNVRGGQTAYNTGTGFWIGYTGGAYKFSIGNPSSGYLRWTGTALEVYGSIVDTRPFAAGTTPVAAASTEVFMPGAALAWAETKSITVPRAGVLRCTWDIYAGTTGSNTKARIYKNGVATSSEFTYTTIAWHSSTYDITVAAGDEVQLYTYWSSTQGKARNFVLSNSFNESFFVVTLDSY